MFQNFVRLFILESRRQFKNKILDQDLMEGLAFAQVRADPDLVARRCHTCGFHTAVIDTHQLLHKCLWHESPTIQFLYMIHCQKSPLTLTRRSQILWELNGCRTMKCGFDQAIESLDYLMQ